jgi:large subunit ribosomal protein L25
MADSKRPALQVDERPERGSSAVRRLRRSGLVPGVVYGGDKKQVAFKVGGRELRLALAESGAVIDLKVENQRPRPVIVKEQQHHPVKDELLHVDLLEVNLREKIEATVPLELVGADDAPAVKQGGVFGYVLHEVSIEALPADLPESIEADVSHMEGAATMLLSELTAPEGVEFVDPPDTMVATVTLPSEIEETEEVEEEAELVGEEAAEAGEGQEAPPESESGGSENASP